MINSQLVQNQSFFSILLRSLMSKSQELFQSVLVNNCSSKQLFQQITVLVNNCSSKQQFMLMIFFSDQLYYLIFPVHQKNLLISKKPYFYNQFILFKKRKLNVSLVIRNIIMQQENLPHKLQNSHSTPQQIDINLITDFSNLSTGRESGLQSFDSLQINKGSHLTSSSINSDYLSFDENRQDNFFSTDSTKIWPGQNNNAIWLKKIQRKDIQFKTDKLLQPFIKMMSDLLYKFCNNHSQESFKNLLQAMSTCEKPFKTQISIMNQKSSKMSIQVQFQDLFYRNQHMYLTCTFDFLVCHYSFVSLILFYWNQADKLYQQKDEHYLMSKSRKYKLSMWKVIKLYVRQRSQQINLYMPLFLVIYYLLNQIKIEKIQHKFQVNKLQSDLILSLQLFRGVKRRQYQFFKSSDKIIFQTQLRKYQHQNKLINQLQQTQLIIKLINLYTFTSNPLLKYYRLYGFEKSRQQYQHKKEVFCIWVMLIVVRVCQKNTAESLHRASHYIVSFMCILKKYRQNNNLQGMSYLIPILQNIKVYLPKIWSHAISRRQEIQEKLKDHSDFLLKKQFKNICDDKSYIIWQETIYGHIDKFKQKICSDVFNLSTHQQFYKRFLQQLVKYRKNVRKQYERQLQLYNRQKKIGISFNMYLLDSYLLQLFKKKDISQEWKQLKTRCEKANQSISVSFYNNFIDYCFIGSSIKYKQADL